MLRYFRTRKGRPQSDRCQDNLIETRAPTVSFEESEAFTRALQQETALTITCVATEPDDG